MKKLLIFLVLLTVSPIFAQPSITEVKLPQYIQGISGTNNKRMPYACLLTLSGLSASSTYRYFNQVVISSDAATTNGAGNVIFRNNSGSFTRTTGPSMSTAGNYSEFTTDASGSYTGWFINEPTGNSRFAPGNDIYIRIMLNNGAGGTTVATRLTTSSSVKVINFGTNATANEGSALYGITSPVAIAKNFVMLYDNIDGTGRPISCTFIEADGTANTTANSYAAFYSDNVNEQEGRYGTIIPNLLPDGIKRIEQRALLTGLDAPGDIIGYETSSNGVWGTVDTKNPTNGDGTSLIVNTGALPVKLNSFSYFLSGRNVKLIWQTGKEVNNSGFEIQRKNIINDSWDVIGFVGGQGTKDASSDYSFEDKNLPSGKFVYRLKQIDYNGNFEYFELNGTVEISLPVKFELSQNYPNPFNPVTKINFSLPKDSRVELRVFDALGREISVLANGDFKAGYHTVEFNGSSLASGVYFYKITAGNYSNIMRMMLIK